MALDSNIVGALSGTGADVNAARQLKVVPETNLINNAGNVGLVRMVGENDAGSVTGVPLLVSPEVDADYRLRVSQDLILDEEVFNYTAQNTGKHQYSNTTMTAVWTAGQITTNGTSITTTTTGVQILSYAMFPCTGTTTLSGDFELGWSALPQTNTIFEFGFGLGGAQTTAPTDGVFFRLTSAGLQGIAANNSTETSTGIFPLADGTGVWEYVPNKKYQFIVYISAVVAEFWVNDGSSSGTVLLGKIELPAAQARMTMASSLPICIKHRNVGGAAGGVMQGQVGAYNVRQGGTANTSTPSTAGLRSLGSYQGLGGGTMGSLANYANSANPTAAVATNTTAALGTGLGGQFWETATIAVNTDGIICSYQVPAGTPNIQGRRLVIRGIGLTSYVQTAITGGPFVTQYSLAFGHTAVSLATAEAATAKAPRRLPLSQLTQVVTAGQAVSTLIAQSGQFVDLGDAPIFVNPGEFVALVAKKVGTAATAGVIAHMVTFVYGWE